MATQETITINLRVGRNAMGEVVAVAATTEETVDVDDTYDDYNGQAGFRDVKIAVTLLVEDLPAVSEAAVSVAVPDAAAGTIASVAVDADAPALA